MGMKTRAKAHPQDEESQAEDPSIQEGANLSFSLSLHLFALTHHHTLSLAHQMDTSLSLLAKMASSSH